MGVDITFYVVHGVKVPYNPKLSKDLYDYMDKHGDQEIPFVVDGMSCGYIVLGNILYSGEAYQDDMFKEIDYTNLLVSEIKYRDKFIHAFPQHIPQIAKEPFKILAFIHYS